MQLICVWMQLTYGNMFSRHGIGSWFRIRIQAQEYEPLLLRYYSPPPAPPNSSVPNRPGGILKSHNKHKCMVPLTLHTRFAATLALAAQLASPSTGGAAAKCGRGPNANSHLLMRHPSAAGPVVCSAAVAVACAPASLARAPALLAALDSSNSVSTRSYCGERRRRAGMGWRGGAESGRQEGAPSRSAPPLLQTTYPSPHSGPATKKSKAFFT